ncbi:MAG TPA: cyclase family protein [Actinomycetota bacterium]|nr:cyclase family protein [Actinomycetota bacterium]
MTRIVDLSQDIYTGMMVYPGHLKTVLFDHATHEETAPRFDSGFSFQTKGFLLNDNGPTHVDSFSHLDPDPSAETIDRMPLDLFYGDAVCVDVTGAEPRTDIPVSRVEEGLTDAGLEVRPDDIVLFYTGTATKLGGTPAYLSEFPGLGVDVADWIVERRVKSFGIDTCTPDNPSSRIYPIHMMGREHHITHYENLTNLDQVVGRRFTFIGLPLKLKGAHGGPTRAAALLDD